MKKTGLVLLTLVLSACGNNSDSGNGIIQQGVDVNPIQGYCAPNVIDAYNNFAQRCTNINSDLDRQACRFSAEHFLRNYAGISCVAVPMAPGQGPFFGNFQGQQVFHITDAPMREVLQMLDQYRGGNPNWRRGYRPWPRMGGRR